MLQSYFFFGSMFHVVYKHERAARILAKQLRFNHRYFRKNEEKSAVKLMVIVIGLFLVCCACYLRCSLVYIMKDEQPCNDKRFKLPLLVLNSAINPVAYAFFKSPRKSFFNNAPRQANSEKSHEAKCSLITKKFPWKTTGGILRELEI